MHIELAVRRQRASPVPLLSLQIGNAPDSKGARISRKSKWQASLFMNRRGAVISFPMQKARLNPATAFFIHRTADVLSKGLSAKRLPHLAYRISIASGKGKCVSNLLQMPKSFLTFWTRLTPPMFRKDILRRGFWRFFFFVHQAFRNNLDA